MAENEVEEEAYAGQDDRVEGVGEGKIDSRSPRKEGDEWDGRYGEETHRARSIGRKRGEGAMARRGNRREDCAGDLPDLAALFQHGMSGNCVE